MGTLEQRQKIKNGRLLVYDQFPSCYATLREMTDQFQLISAMDFNVVLLIYDLTRGSHHVFPMILGEILDQDSLRYTRQCSHTQMTHITDPVLYDINIWKTESSRSTPSWNTGHETMNVMGQFTAALHEYGYSELKSVFDFYQAESFAAIRAEGGYDLCNFITEMNAGLVLLPAVDPGGWCQQIVLPDRPGLFIIIKYTKVGSQGPAHVVVANVSDQE